MDCRMAMANLLADNVDGFIQFVSHNLNNESVFVKDTNKIIQLSLLINEYKFQLVSDELHRINQFHWNEKYTHLLAEDLLRGVTVIDEFVERNNQELFIFSARLHTIKNLIASVLGRAIHV
ncbi:MAG: hypothetical protein ACI4XL_11120 [Bacillus sp. (in: firmicutes)]